VQIYSSQQTKAKISSTLLPFVKRLFEKNWKDKNDFPYTGKKNLESFNLKGYIITHIGQ
jgi:hypothetical protein